MKNQIITLDSLKAVRWCGEDKVKNISFFVSRLSYMLSWKVTSQQILDDMEEPRNLHSLIYRQVNEKLI